MGERSLRIAYVIPAYPPAPSQPFVVNEMIAVQDAGHAVVVAPLYAGRPSSLRHGTFASFRPAAVLPPALFDARVLALACWTLLTRPHRALPVLASIVRAAGRNPFAQIRLLAVMPKALATAWRLRRAGVDRIHAHFATQTADCAAIAGTITGIPFSFTAHAYDIYSTAPRVRNETLQWKLRRARQVFTVNEFAAELLRRQLPAAARERVQTVYVGIPLHLFHAEAAPRAPVLRLLSVARLCEKKGLDTLLDACGLLRDRGLAFELYLYGDGPARGELEAQVRALRLHDQVVLGGRIPQEEVARQMRACHVFVLPCRRDRSGDMDGIPTVFMEAMATGRPVVSCPVSGIPELVRDGETGLLVPPNDAAALADAVARLATDEALRERLSVGARALVERQHDQRLTARHLLQLVTAPRAAS